MKYPNIEAERARHGLSKTSLCTILGVTQKSYRNWQSGSHDMPVKTLCRLARTFNCSADYLLEGEGNGTLDEH